MLERLRPETDAVGMLNRIVPGTLAVVIVVAGCTSEVGTVGSSVWAGEEVLSVGVLDGAEDQVLGSVDDIRLGDAGDVFILDAQSHRLRRFDSGGNLLAAVGQEGDGPGDFSYPSAIALLGDSVVAVLNQAHQYLTLFETDSLSLVGTQPLPSWFRDFCFIGDRMFALRLIDGHVIHEVDASGEVVASFGEAVPFPTDPEDTEGLGQRLAEHSGLGELLCHQATESILVLPHILPNLRSWSSDGDLNWEVVLNPYYQTRAGSTDRGHTLGADPETGLATNAVSLFSGDDGSVIAQLIDRSQGQPAGEETPRSVLIDLNSREMIDLGEALPRTEFLREGVAYGWEEMPFPRVFARVIEWER